MANSTSQHILSTSANLLGFCLFVITSIHINNASKNNLIDEFTSIIALLLVGSVIFSFLSIRTQDVQKEEKLENIADQFFFISIIGILFIILFMVIKYW
ncbi:MAG: hypothetical protein PHQ90_05070 [Sulfuricurvum sp.]|uniref:hypothetical protein n=1 Tax=Sulfuricurvum sp. TaxID=2025608 RepID=UPI002613746E|nr:hypothetical protein [Sulfuricurvum sp.]MDD2368653.1 hypothetical protein [Sulfuricurvum sp.]MDD5117958.1 hypothetical protein [Sulfuricurvum sp.]